MNADRIHRIAPAAALAALVGSSGCGVIDIPVGSNLSGGSGADAGACPTGPVGVWEDITPPGVDLDPASTCGMQDVVVDPGDGKTLILSTCNSGLWKSPDCGVHWIHVNTGANGALLDMGKLWTLAVDPVDPQILYTVSWPAGGIWKSTNGGVDFAQLFPDDNVTSPINGGGAKLPDIYSIDIDPRDHLHLLASFHIAWATGADGGCIESVDGGASWVLHPPAVGMGYGHCIFFLDDSASWLMVSENPFGSGSWLTTNAGGSWTKVSPNQHLLSGCQLYKAANGAIYHSGTYGVFRSADHGLTWTMVLNVGGGAAQGLAGDGSRIYASNYAALPVLSTPYNPTYAAPEIPGDTGWAELGTQQLPMGAKRLAVDRERHIVYSGNWNGGAFRMVTP